MRTIPTLVICAAAALPLGACGGSKAERGRGGQGETSYHLSAGSEGEASNVASLSAAWFDGFALRGRSNSRVRATREEIDAYLYSQGRGPSQMAMSHER